MAYIEMEGIDIVICEATHRLGEIICGGVLIKFAEMGVKVYDATGLTPFMIAIRRCFIVMYCSVSPSLKNKCSCSAGKGRAAKRAKTGKPIVTARYLHLKQSVEIDKLREI